MSNQTATDHGAVAASAVLPVPHPQDHRCDQCGYNTVGLAPTGNCPECGLAIAAGITPPQNPEHVRRVRIGLEVVALSAAVLLASLSAAALCALIGATFLIIFAIAAAALGALGLFFVSPLVLAVALRGRQWLCVLPAAFVCFSMAYGWRTADEFIIVAVLTTAAWGFGFGVQSLVVSTAELLFVPTPKRQARRFMLFTRIALFIPVAACWMVCFAFTRPRDQGEWGVMDIVRPVHQCSFALILLWLACACIHWFIILRRLRD